MIESKIILCCVVLCKLIVVVVRLLRVVHHAAELHRCFQRLAVLIILVNVDR